MLYIGVSPKLILFYEIVYISGIMDEERMSCIF